MRSKDLIASVSHPHRRSPSPHLFPGRSQSTKGIAMYSSPLIAHLYPAPKRSLKTYRPAQKALQLGRFLLSTLCRPIHRCVLYGVRELKC